MGATESPYLKTALLSAALALPHVFHEVQAETAPERASVSFKVLEYRDSQPDAERIRVKAPALSAVLPLNPHWSVAGAYVTDSISGASPLYHNKLLSPLRDFRRAADLSVTNYHDRGTWSLGLADSREADYLSRSVSAGLTGSDESKNTVWSLTGSLMRDRINPANEVVENESKKSIDLLAGVTQVLTVRDIVQLNLGWSQSRGYLSDPYKLLDERPRSRTRQTAQVRWNHHVDALNATLRMGYRHFRDDWGVRAHTLDLEHVQPITRAWKASASVRYHTQSAARFYVDADGSRSPFAPPPPQGASFYSLDQRLSSFGAGTWGLKIAHQWGEDTVVDLKYERYEQRGTWAAGTGSPNLPPLRARSIQFGLTHWL